MLILNIIKKKELLNIIFLNKAKKVFKVGI